METQLLVNVLAVGPIAPLGELVIPHGLKVAGVGVVPTQVFPDRATSLIVSNADETNIFLINPSGVALSANFRCEYDHSIHAVGATLLKWQGNDGASGGVLLAGDVTGPSGANTVERLRNTLIDPLLAAATNDKLGWNGSYWTQQSPALGNAYDVSSFVTGFPTAGQTLMQVQGVRNSRISRIRISAAIAPLADATFLLASSSGGSISVTLTAGSTQAVASAGGVGYINWADSGFLTLTAPAVQDVQMQTVRWTVQGTVS